MRNGSEKLNWI